jgi:hypothetical protein
MKIIATVEQSISLGTQRRSSQLKTLNEWIKTNIDHNSKQNYHHITDPYFKEKLNQGLIKYAPEEWTELSPHEEREIG